MTILVFLFSSSIVSPRTQTQSELLLPETAL